ncbi:hypothetical protein BK708_12105 [Bacillus thuringiensis serovar yunnanensis]|nr:hypothetical protein BK708_12105 [Bacillus thuringiensis serovar yunnanensis]
MKDCGKIEQQFNKLKDKGLEQPRWHDQNRYLLHVQLVLLIHNIALFILVLQNPPLKYLIHHTPQINYLPF